MFRPQIPSAHDIIGIGEKITKTTDRDYFVTATVPWFHTNEVEVFANIAKMIGVKTAQEIFHLRHDASLTERVFRWDRRPPLQIFKDGFVPRTLAPYPTSQPMLFDLRGHVLGTSSTLYITTERYQGSDASGASLRWRPSLQSIDPNEEYYEYELVVPCRCEIEVDKLVMGGNHPEIEARHLVAFPGGILPKFIYSATCYRGRHTVKRVKNDDFVDCSAPGAIAMIPLPSIVPLKGRLEPMIYHGSHEDEDGLMRSPGGLAMGIPREFGDARRARVECAAYPNDKGRAYFFCEDQYMLVNINAGKDDTIAWGPHDISGHWPSLVKAHFAHGVDAIFPNPEKSDELYFFSGEKCVRVNAKPGSTDDYIVAGPHAIAEQWPSLAKTGFKTVDAALLDPSDKYEVYFFSGERYVRIRFEPGKTNDTIISGPSLITDDWPSLKKAEFATVDMVLPHPEVSHKVYFFSGDKYVLIRMKSGSREESIVRGPLDIHSGWPSLHKAGFY